jgi:glyoxylase-like metal-dependent hydrolase (beta-lactamase superfamily II)
VAVPDELNRVPMALNCLLILSEGKRILAEAGFGTKLSPKQVQNFALQQTQGGLLENLQRLGYAASDIDVVINTHLHTDHCGGNTLWKDGVPVPAFPRAEYWLQRLEWADACYPNERTSGTYLPENFLVLQQSGQLRLISGDTRVTGEVRCMRTRGHTRGHQSVVVESAGETAIFLGDVAPRVSHLERLNWSTAYDSEPLETVEAKRSLRQWACERNALLVFGHDVAKPFGRLRKEGDQFRVEAV